MLHARFLEENIRQPYNFKMHTILKTQAILMFFVLFCYGCRGNGEDTKGDDNTVDYFEGEPESVDPSCTGVRLTAYTASSGGWCEFDRTLDILPEDVRRGMTFAVAEPWNGGSYEGESGEACGECWEVNTVNGTSVVMVHDLCPIEGNPLCSGGFFHFDLSTEAATALGGGGLDAATAKRVTCPVTGNVHAQINDANEWGYLRLAFVNHKVAVRTARVRALPDGKWLPMERSGGAWHIISGPTPSDGSGIGFELTSPLGETIESSSSLAINPAKGTIHDLGVQFENSDEPKDECAFTPPGDVFVDAFGGIEGVTWAPNPWGDNATIEEIKEACAKDSSRCLNVRLGQWEGAHLYYRQPFPVETFQTLSLSFYGLQDSSEIVVAPSNDGERCSENTVKITENEWTIVDISLSDVCTAGQSLNGVTFSCNTQSCNFLLDDVLYH